MNFTTEQQMVLDARRGNILVSAAAGSGKTAVLTERIVRRVRQELVDIDNVLVLTFTDNAAINMRQKIEEKLRLALRGAKDESTRRRLEHQLARLPLASISTMHSFCLKTLRDYANLLTTPDGNDLLIKTDLRIMTPEDRDRLLDECVDRVLRARYIAAAESAHPETEVFLHLTDMFASGRSDNSLRELLLSMYNKLRSMADYREIVTGLIERLKEDAESFPQSLVAEHYYERLRLLVRRYGRHRDELWSLLNDPDLFLIKNKKENAARVQVLLECVERLDRICQYVMTETRLDWDTIHRLGKPITLDFKLSLRKTDDSLKTRTIQLLRSVFGELAHMLNGRYGTKSFTDNYVFNKEGVFDHKVAEIEADTRRMLPQLECLVELLLELDDTFLASKQLRGEVDFADFEHYALRLLRQPEVSLHYREIFKEIYVDEFQDTSSIQNSLLSELANENQFVVGDIKQSIYRFRHARPEIFEQIKRTYLSHRDEGTCFELHRNFRSSDTILRAVNQIFSLIMKENVAEIEYVDGHQFTLPQNDEDREPEQAPVRWIVGRDDQVSEAELMIETIRGLIAAGRQYGEIAVLMRTNDACKSMIKALNDAGIRASSDLQVKYQDLYEINLLTSLVQVLDNARQDYPLISVMASPLLGQPFTEAEMALARQTWVARGGSRRAPFSEVVFADFWREEHSEPARRLESFRDRLNEVRGRLTTRPISMVFEELMAETGLVEQLAIMSDGARRTRNVEAFMDWIRQYETGYRTDIGGFSRFLQQREDVAFEHKKLTKEDAERLNAVTVITSHSSKGLEFPVVMIGSMSRNIHGRPALDGKVDFSEKLGLAFQVFQDVDGIMYTWKSMQYKAVEMEVRQAHFAEELRLLYVAMTRAEQELYLLSPDFHKMVEKIEQGFELSSTDLRDEDIAGLKTYDELLLAALLSSGEFSADALSRFLTADPQPSSAQLLTGATGWRLIAPPSEMEVEEEEKATPVRAISDLMADSLFAKEGLQDRKTAVTSLLRAPKSTLARAVSQKTVSTDIPLKITVVEMKRRSDRFDAERAAEAGLPLRAINLVPQRSAETRFEDDLRNGADLLAGAELGTALHKAFRFLDVELLRAAGTEEATTQQLRWMVADGCLSDREFHSLLPFANSLLTFSRSDLAARILDAEALGPDGTDECLGVFREIPFTLTIPAAGLYPTENLSDDDQIMVQGIIDLWFEIKGRCTLVDYKSDRVPSGMDPDSYFIENYRSQLEIYAEAVRRAARLPIDRMIIWSVRHSRAIEIPQD
ncbi:MAG: UvrD-helicase domain-containing protein [Fastidiosipilaceae bacterium]|jgi:ATP-dependent helicase/nuclease subunit A